MWFQDGPRCHFGNEKSNLRKLGKNKELHPQSGAATSVGTTGIQTEVITQRHVVHVVKEVRSRTDHANKGKNGEKCVPSGQGVAVVQSLALGEISASPNNAQSVECYSENGDPGVVLHPTQDGNGVVVLFGATGGNGTRC